MGDSKSYRASKIVWAASQLNETQPCDSRPAFMDHFTFPAVDWATTSLRCWLPVFVNAGNVCSLAFQTLGFAGKRCC